MSDRLAPLPLLRVQRDLLDEARGPGRFGRYLNTMLADGADGADGPDRANGAGAADDAGQGRGRTEDAGRASASDASRPNDLELPLSVFNPMAKGHVARRLDALLDAGAEDALVAALAGIDARVASRASPDGGPMRVGLVVADDAAGGWTDRVLTDEQHRFGSAPTYRRGFVVVLLWSGDPDEPASQLRRRVEIETRAAVFRAAWEAEHGAAETLAERMAQEGAAARFAGAVPGFGDLPAPHALHGDLREAVARVLEPHRASTAKPVVVAALYGDEAAASVGYTGLGIPAAGGFLVAAAEAPDDPVLALSGEPVG